MLCITGLLCVYHLQILCKGASASNFSSGRFISALFGYCSRITDFTVISMSIQAVFFRSLSAKKELKHKNNAMEHNNFSVLIHCLKRVQCDPFFQQEAQHRSARNQNTSQKCQKSFCC